MTSKFILNRTRLEKISASEMKAIAVVLTQKGAGTVICPNCNTLNIVRDGIFLCCCGFSSDIVDCGCGICQLQLLDKSLKGSLRQFINGHNSRGKNNSMFGKHHSDVAKSRIQLGRLGKRSGEKNWRWKGGWFKDEKGYIRILTPKHPRNHRGYVEEQILVYEAYLGRFLNPEEFIHHRDGDPGNNKLSNLQLVSSHLEHNRIHGRQRTEACKQRGLKCFGCDSNYVVKDGGVTLRCQNCGKCWRMNYEEGEKYFKLDHKFMSDHFLLLKLRGRKRTPENQRSIERLLLKLRGRKEAGGLA